MIHQASQGGDQLRGEVEIGIGIGGISSTGLMHVERGILAHCGYPPV